MWRMFEDGHFTQYRPTNPTLNNNITGSPPSNQENMNKDARTASKSNGRNLQPLGGEKDRSPSVQGSATKGDEM